MWEYIAVHTPVNTPDYRLDLDEFRDGERQFMLIHITVKKLRPGLLKQMQADWQVFRQHVTCPLFAIAEVEDDKWRKFVSLFGFQPLTDVICNNGASRHMYVSYAPKKNNNEQLVQSEPICEPSQL